MAQSEFDVVVVGGGVAGNAAGAGCVAGVGNGNERSGDRLSLGGRRRHGPGRNSGRVGRFNDHYQPPFNKHC